MGDVTMCDFMGQDFGAAYPDSVCIDGYLWDADSGNADPNGEGWIYDSGGEIPCPSCNEKAAAKYAGKPLKKIRSYVAHMKEKWGTFGAPASLRAANSAPEPEKESSK
jgi:hypothetical protein